MNNIIGILFLTAAAASAQVISTLGPTWAAPGGVAVDASGNVFVADAEAHTVYRLSTTGSPSIYAGQGSAGFGGDGGRAEAALLNSPRGLAADSSGNLYVADCRNNRVRRITPSGVISTYAGGGSVAVDDGIPATSAALSCPETLAVDGGGNLFIADTSHRVRRVSPQGLIQTVAGRAGVSGFSGDGGPAVAGLLRMPKGLALDGTGSLLIADYGNHRVRRVDPAGIIRTVAGSDRWGYCCDGEPATSAGLHYPYGVAGLPKGHLLVSDSFSHRVRLVDERGVITTVAGGGRAASSLGDSGPATDAVLYRPEEIKTDSRGVLYIVDSLNKRLRVVTAVDEPANAPTISSVSPAFSGRTGFASGSYLEIIGANLSPTTRTWTDSDFQGNAAPTSLDGVSVLINGKHAAVAYISPRQVNIVVPTGATVGPASIVVRNRLGESRPFSTSKVRVAPALQTSPQFVFAGRFHVVAQAADYSTFIGPANALATARLRGARPGETITLYALGCGPTSANNDAGDKATSPSSLLLPFEVRIGGRIARTLYAGSAVGFVSVYQFNVVVPEVADGIQPIELVVDGVANAQNLSLQIGTATGTPDPPAPPPSPGSGVPSGLTTITSAAGQGWSFHLPDSWEVVRRESKQWCVQG